MITESHLRSLFDTGHGKGGGDLAVPIEGDKDEDDENQDLHNMFQILNKQAVKPRKGT